jgi:hypothetical protein
MQRGTYFVHGDLLGMTFDRIRCPQCLDDWMRRSALHPEACSIIIARGAARLRNSTSPWPPFQKIARPLEQTQPFSERHLFGVIGATSSALLEPSKLTRRLRSIWSSIKSLRPRVNLLQFKGATCNANEHNGDGYGFSRSVINYRTGIGTAYGGCAASLYVRCNETLQFIYSRRKKDRGLFETKPQRA